MSDEIISVPSSDSVSKNFIQFFYGDKETPKSSSVVTIDSASTFSERVPVSWDKKKSRTLSQFPTPTGIQKVKSWMNHSLANRPNEKHKYKLESPNMLLYRVDFLKGPSGSSSKSPNTTSKESVIRSKSTERSPRKLINRSLRSQSIDVGSKVQKCLMQTCFKNVSITNGTGENYSNSSVKISDVRSEASSDAYDVPLSPESQKKELYHYLKLMNPADKKEILLIQNRRSIRVKNLNMLQEKKELEKKLKENENVKINGLQNGHLHQEIVTMKSCKDLNMKCDIEKDDDEHPFSFPSLHPSNIQKQEHFEIPMKRFLKNVRRSYGKDLESLRNRLAELRKLHTLKSIEDDRVKRNKDKRKVMRIEKKKLLNRQLARGNEIYRSTGKMLRSTGRLKGVGIKKLMLVKKASTKKQKTPSKKRKTVEKRKKVEKRKRVEKGKMIEKRKKTEKENTSLNSCEIVTLSSHDEDSTNFVDDLDLNKMSEEHKRCLIQNRILSTQTPTKSFGSPNSLADSSPFRGFNRHEETDNVPSKLIQLSLEDIEDRTEVRVREPVEFKVPIESVEEDDVGDGDGDGDNSSSSINMKNDQVHQDDHDYAYSGTSSESEEDDDEEDVIIARTIPRMSCEVVSPQKITDVQYEPFSKTVEARSLHRSLLYTKRKNHTNGVESSMCNSSLQSWDSDSSDPKKTNTKSKSQSHSIRISKDNGAVLNAFYIDCNLIVSQEYVVSFWSQSALGNVLGAQNMWVPKGHTSRIMLNNKCIQKKSMEMVFSMESSVAYIELWTKEHKSEVRQGPVADVFATIYFWKQRQNGLEKKVLQIENINGFADDVQYVVLKNAAKIIVSWHSVTENNKITCVHKYTLAPDFATTVNCEIEPVDHYVSSLHNIEDCDSLIMGCGENKITVWNVEHGYVVSTIELNDIKSPLSTLWVKCDRGFLFTLQQCVDRELRLIAINGINHSWKRLQSYIPPEGYDGLKGVCIEHGNLVSFYDKGILCWNAQTAEPVVEDTTIDSDYIPSGSYVIIVVNDQILVRNALTHLLTLEES